MDTTSTNRPNWNPVIGTLAYLWSATMVFGGFLSAYFVLRADAGAWPPPGQPRLPLALSATNTLILLASGVLVWMAYKSHGLSEAGVWLRRAAWLGGIFLLVQGFEWARMLGHGLTVASSGYGSTFYTIVGTHAVHAIGGFLILMINASSSRLSQGRLAACCLYWGFVVLVWPVLYVLLYLV